MRRLTMSVSTGLPVIRNDARPCRQWFARSRRVIDRPKFHQPAMIIGNTLEPAHARMGEILVVQPREQAMGRWIRLVGLLAGIVITLGSSAAPKPAPAHHLRVTLTADTIEIEKAAPGGTVLVVGYERIVRDFAPVYRRVQRERTADGKGSVSVPIGRPIAPVSFWVAFDLETGGHGAVGGSKHKLREGELADDSMKNGLSGKKTKFAAPLDYVYLLTIRPKTGVWEMTAGDGGVSDEDGALNGSFQADTVRFGKTRHAQTDYDAFEKGDIVAMFVPHQMGYLITKVKQ